MKSKSLKKASAALLCAVIALMSAVTVFAAGQTYHIHDISDMAITLPEDFTAVTRDSDANDKYFSLFGIDYNTNKQNFESSNIYLQGMNSSSDLMVTVTMTETEDSKNLGNYSQLEADKLSEIARNFLSHNEYTSCTVDQAVSNVVWLEFDARVNSSGSLIHAYQANTVFDGQTVIVTLQRKGENVSSDDYEVFSNIISGVEFHKVGLFDFSNPYLPYILIGGGVLLILIIVLIIVIVKISKRRRKKSKNDKILEELAGKYTTSRTDRQSQQDDDNESDYIESDRSEDEDLYDIDSHGFEDDNSANDRSYSDGYGADEVAPAKTREPGRRYSDEEIEALLGDDKGEKPNFIQALPKVPEEQTAAKDDTIDKTDQVSEFFEDEPSQPEVEVQSETTKKFDFPVKAKHAEHNEELTVIEAELISGQPESQEEIAENNEPEPEKEITETIEPEPEEEITEAIEPEPKEKPSETIEPESQEDSEQTVPEQVDASEQPEQEPAEDSDVIEAKPREHKENKGSSLRDEIRNALLEFDSNDYNENEEDDYNNDEVLVRDEAKHTKFVDSSDYFEEAPGKVMGVISSKDIQNAEEYDVIGEMERRADEVEKEPPQKGEAVTKALKSAGNGVKSFFVHCGYFITNVKRERQRKKAEEKRRQYEEDRKRRARERAERQRLQAENGGLVQVHKRTDRKPPQRRPSPQPQRRPNQKKRRPNQKKHRPSSQQRRPVNHQNRTGVPPRKR